MAKKKKKKGGKKVLKILVILLLVAVVSGAGSCFLILKKSHGPEPVENFVFEDNSAPSITSVVGSRVLSKVTAEETQSEYDYKKVPSTEDDIKQYVQHLMDNYNFIAMDEGFDIENLSPDGGTITLATETSKKKCIFQMDINYTSEDYNVVLSTPEGSLPKKEPMPFTRDDAYAFLSNNADEIGLPKEVSSYEAVFDVGQTIIDGAESYGISIYQKEPENGNANVIVGKFFIPLDQSCIFKYDIHRGVYIPLASK